METVPHLLGALSVLNYRVLGQSPALDCALPEGIPFAAVQYKREPPRLAGAEGGGPGQEGRGYYSRREGQAWRTPPSGSDATKRPALHQGQAGAGRAQHGGSGREFATPVAAVAAATPARDGGSGGADGGRDGQEAVWLCWRRRHGRGAEPLSLLRGVDSHTGAHVSLLRRPPGDWESRARVASSGGPGPASCPDTQQTLPTGPGFTSTPPPARCELCW